jgi:DNA helicase-2/ATP-dependent DNA helicase PcrA
LIPGVGPAKAAALYQYLGKSGNALQAVESSDTMALLPTKSKGFFAGFVDDLRKLRATHPETNPAAAIGAILKGGYPATVRLKYERPDNRIADLEQFALLADKYDSLERLVSDLILAGDVYGMDSVAAEETRDVLVLSTIHQAKGLEWSHVFILRVIQDSFPHRRALDEPGGEEEERRIFYVGISRAMNELTLSYPLSLPRGARGPIVFTTPSRFLLELEEGLFERAQVESGAGDQAGDLWSSFAGPSKP